MNWDNATRLVQDRALAMCGIDDAELGESFAIDATYSMTGHAMLGGLLCDEDLPEVVDGLGEMAQRLMRSFLDAPADDREGAMFGIILQACALGAALNR